MNADVAELEQRLNTLFSEVVVDPQAARSADRPRHALRP